jgi:hypothetical protein
LVGPVAIDYAEGVWELHKRNNYGPEHKLVRPRVYEERG